MTKSAHEHDKHLELKTPPRDPTLRWLSPTSPLLSVQGLYWFKSNRGSFSRFPLSAKSSLRPPVWDLAQCPAGGCIAFRSDTTVLRVRVTNRDTSHMPHMPLSGSNGLSLYAGQPGALRPWGSAIPDMTNPWFEREFFNGIKPAMRDYRIYLPLYHPLQALEIGISKRARLLKPTPPVIAKPVVFYGTSITQGGCASTAGSDFISIMGRLLNLNMINLGFSGNGQGDIEVARLMAGMNASLFALDYLSNVNPEKLRETLDPFYKTLRNHHPKTPILLVSPVCFWQADFKPESIRDQELKRDILISFYAQKRTAGDTAIHFADAFDMLHFAAGAAYVDGVHPTDAGFSLLAHRLAPVLQRILLRNVIC
ncbi:MAG: hypothetical protein A2498_12655 [Lentisphaerae bacterium RIFOXYC12_FULL_60_16]|nr:MAG: hypothetical protein A2498_12655 [Lentisphaerae bacterium RIFOXYC12_FULL_60_16]OGV79171.1 MAG: hypothetical protein A2340_05150 [Lentisphaerae bacterium RIFOXYB12_FULL_60_10]